MDQINVYLIIIDIRRSNIVFFFGLGEIIVADIDIFLSMAG